MVGHAGPGGSTATQAMQSKQIQSKIAQFCTVQLSERTGKGHLHRSEILYSVTLVDTDCKDNVKIAG